MWLFWLGIIISGTGKSATSFVHVGFRDGHSFAFFRRVQQSLTLPNSINTSPSQMKKKLCEIKVGDEFIGLVVSLKE
jgi:hypothetical protein